MTYMSQFVETYEYYYESTKAGVLYSHLIRSLTWFYLKLLLLLNLNNFNKVTHLIFFGYFTSHYWFGIFMEMLCQGRVCFMKFISNFKDK